jgi:nicotinamide/nicotinate riboside kinase
MLKVIKWKQFLITILDATEKYHRTQSVVTDETDTGNTSSGINTANGCGDKQTSGVHILIIEGFLIFNDKKLADLCHCKYFLTLTREQCWARRSIRTYDPQDVPGYFDQCVWPGYEKHHDEVFKQVPNVIVIDGNQDRTSVLKQVLLGITQTACELLQSQKS